VRVHDAAFARVEAGRLVEYLVGNAQFADVVQQAGDFQLFAARRRDLQIVCEQPGQARDAERVLGSEGALGVDDAREDAGQLLEFAGIDGPPVGFVQAVGQTGLDVAHFQAQPESLRTRGLQEGGDQCRVEIAAVVAADGVADFLGRNEQATVAVVWCGEGIDAVDQEDQVGRLPNVGGQVVGQSGPRRVVMADRLGVGLEWRKLAQQFGAGQAVLLGAFPVEFGDQMVVGDGRRDADVVQQAEFEQEEAAFRRQVEHFGHRGGHDADPFAVADVVDADQVEGVGQRIDQVTESGGEGRGHIVLSGGFCPWYP